MNNGTLSEEIYLRLRADIRNGNLEPSSPLRLDTLKARYGIGATPIREALNRLSAENLVLAKGGSGFRVAAISMKEFEEIVALREDLEKKALFSSIRNGDDSWEARIVACLHGLSKLSLYDIGNDRQALEERETRHRDFHVALIQACNSDWLVRLWRQLSEHEERYRRIALRDVTATRAYSDAIEQEHVQLRDAVLRRDSKAAWAVLLPHRRRTIAAVKKLFQD